MTEAVVDVRELRKTFRVTEREEGLAATLRSFVKRRRKDVNAVAGITFQIDAGEVVGFLGPNGAGRPRRSRCCQDFYTQPPATRGSSSTCPGGVRTHTSKA